MAASQDTSSGVLARAAAGSSLDPHPLGGDTKDQSTFASTTTGFAPLGSPFPAKSGPSLGGHEADGARHGPWPLRWPTSHARQPPLTRSAAHPSPHCLQAVGTWAVVLVSSGPDGAQQPETCAKPRTMKGTSIKKAAASPRGARRSPKLPRTNRRHGWRPDRSPAPDTGAARSAGPWCARTARFGGR